MENDAPESNLNTQERLVAKAIYHQVDDVLALCNESNVHPFFSVSISDTQYQSAIAQRVNSYGNIYIQISLDVTPLYSETENKFPLVFFVFENNYFFGIGQMEEMENVAVLQFVDIDDVQTILQLMGKNLPDIDEAVLNLFQEITMQIYDQRPGSAFWEDTEVFLEESNVAAKIHSLIESSNTLLKLKPEKHNYLITPNEPYLDSETGATIKLVIDLYRLPESHGGGLVIEIELLQSGMIRTDIVLRFDEKGNKFKVWTINAIDAETVVEARGISLESAQTELATTALLHLKSILSRHNLPETEDGITAFLQQILSDELYQTEIAKRTELPNFDHGEELAEIYEGYYQQKVEKLKSLIRQYELALQRTEKWNSSYAFYQWKICLAYAELDYLRSWYELAKNRAELKSARKDYLSAVEIAGSLDEKRKIVKKWQGKSGALGLRKNFAMSKRSRDFLRRIGEI